MVRIIMKKITLNIGIIFLAIPLVFSACLNTDPGEDHTNPMDMLYESNGYRVSLFAGNTEKGYQVQWSSIYADAGEIAENDIKAISSSELHWINGNPSAVDIDAVKKYTFTGTSSQSIGMKYDKDKGFAGNVSMATPAVKTSYILRLVFTDRDNKQKTVYSNFFVWEPVN